MPIGRLSNRPDGSPLCSVIRRRDDQGQRTGDNFLDRLTAVKTQLRVGCFPVCQAKRCDASRQGRKRQFGCKDLIARQSSLKPIERLLRREIQEYRQLRQRQITVDFLIGSSVTTPLAIASAMPLV